MKKVLIFLICLIGYQIGCHAQMADEHYYFKNLSVQNGLSQNTVNAILQDKQGFMWFGTKDGLNRYDASSNMMTAHGGALVIILSQLFMRTQKEISG
jgi:ligand-binding sensor domain-containing protein